MHSLWQEKIEFPYYPILKTDKQVDIISGGIPSERSGGSFPKRTGKICDDHGRENYCGHDGARRNGNH